MFLLQVVSTCLFNGYFCQKYNSLCMCKIESACVRKNIDGRNRYCYIYPHPAIAADSVVFAYHNGKLKVLLVKRGGEVMHGYWAFPGGFFESDGDSADYTVEDTAVRELLEETKMKSLLSEKVREELKKSMRLVNLYSRLGRDPRERVVSVAYFSVVEIDDVEGGDDAQDARWIDVDLLVPGYRDAGVERVTEGVDAGAGGWNDEGVINLAFDQNLMIKDALKALKERIILEPENYRILPESFRKSIVM